MKVSIVCNCVLLAFMLYVTATEGRSYPWHKSTQNIRYHSRYGKIQSRAGRVSNHHHVQRTQLQTDLKQLFDETLAEFLQASEPDNHLPQRLPARLPSRLPSRLTPHRLMTNELQDIGIDPQEDALYSATVAEREELIGDDAGQRYMTSEYQSYHEEVCETRRTWTLLNTTFDIDGNVVEIVKFNGSEEQRVYNYECVSPCSACKGVGIRSACKMRQSFVMMYVSRIHNLNSPPYIYKEEPKWEYVSVPSHCACELVPDGYIDGECLN